MCLVAIVDQPEIMCPGHVSSHDFELYCLAVIWLLLLINNLKGLWTSFIPILFSFCTVMGKRILFSTGESWESMGKMLRHRFERQFVVS